MKKEHLDNLSSLRGMLVDDRRNMANTLSTEPHGIGQVAGEFFGIQQLIDTVERAISHEQSLDPAARKRPGGFSAPPPLSPKGA